MSGIIGLFDRGRGGIARENVAAMLDRISHRGPDGEGSWCDDRAGLGHQQLQTTPEATFDEQPYRDGNLVLTADARIDNREELLNRLGLDEPPERIPDSRILMAAYREWGRGCVEHLVGAFAFIIWETGTRRVFCARDHFGAKPLYYYLTDDVFAVASEVKALLALPYVPRILDEVKVGDFLVGLFGDRSNTYFTDIHRLPPAHAMTVGAGGARDWKYWDLDPARKVTLESDAAYTRRFRQLFEEAVRSRLRTDGAVGTTLSGGIDSSSIAVTARDVLPSDETLHTFSWLFDESPTSDEREYIEPVVARDGITPHYIHLDDVGVLVDRKDVYRGIDGPPFNSMHYAWWETSRRAADVGTGVLLTGALGDSAINYGFGLLPDLLKTGHWRQLNRELQQLGELWGTSPRKLFTRLALKPLVPDPVKRKYRELRGKPVLEARWNPTLDPAFVERTGLRSRHRHLYEGALLSLENARQQQYKSLVMGLTTANLEMIDMKCARFGIEPRHPFLDKRLVEFSLAMPANQQLSDGWTRSIIRRSLDDLLPEKVRKRPWKTPVSEGFWHALSLEGKRLEDVLDNPGELTRYLDEEALRAAYDRFRNHDPPDPHEARALWRALSLSTWLEEKDFDTRP